MHLSPSEPSKQPGPLYDPSFEHDACGTGFVVQRTGQRGDGAGILTQLPSKLIARDLAHLGVRAPAAGDVAVGMIFMPLRNLVHRERSQELFQQAIGEFGLEFLGWREVPVNLGALGEWAINLRPYIVQAFVGRPPALAAGGSFERALYLVRKRATQLCWAESISNFYIASLSSRTIVYKGLFMAPQLAKFYVDVADPDFETALAVFHQRYSTNTFPTWERAQPFRLLCHNGEINTLRGNINWMRARQVSGGGGNLGEAGGAEGKTGNQEDQGNQSLPARLSSEPASQGLRSPLSESYLRYAELVQRRPAASLRDLLDFAPRREPVPLDEVEPAEAILRRFSSAAMSHGALSGVTHETLAIAMNRLGGASNSGEGGEDEARYGGERNSKIKQVASGRFGVTPAYLMAAQELQIKMAQGSKPGEGGQLPGHKVTEEIARLRHSTPGVALISPPPHHDIYSIEDLAQLIFDLKQVNPEAAVSVKLVSEAGVGTVAAGVAKGHADLIHLSGADGGTGASPLSSIKHAGGPWELGLAETQHTLLTNGLRGRVRVRVDGGFRSGRDVVIGAMLGADEFSFGTAALIAVGCKMARSCRTNTCPVGVATQRADLVAKFPGQPEHLMVFMHQVAEEVRQILARLGYRSLNEVIGHAELLTQAVTGKEAGYLDLQSLLWTPDTGQPRRNVDPRNPLPVGADLDDRLAAEALDQLGDHGPPVRLRYAIANTDRTVGARLSGQLARRCGNAGLPAGSIVVELEGTAGQSLGAFLCNGIHLQLTGQANDYVGKGLGGGEIVLRPQASTQYTWHENVILGNTALYGATGGVLYAAGRAGERFAVRNSGASAVVEGVGDHGCEYMTGGVVVILGETGRNFGAGMTGGLAFVYDPADVLPGRYNPQLITLRRVRQAAGSVMLRPTGTEASLRSLLRQHCQLTGSARAKEILDDWDAELANFWLVLPKEAVAAIEAVNEGAEGESRQVDK